MVDSSPNLPTPLPQPAVAAVKIATPDLILWNNESTPIEAMVDLIFENIGGQELIGITRNDLVDGQDIIYQPIKNLTSLYFQYNPQNILGMQSPSETYFSGLSIKFEDKIPNIGTGPNGETVYIDSDETSETYGSLIINLLNLSDDEVVNVQIQTKGKRFNGTIYGAV